MEEVDAHCDGLNATKLFILNWPILDHVNFSSFSIDEYTHVTSPWVQEESGWKCSKPSPRHRGHLGSLLPPGPLWVPPALEKVTAGSSTAKTADRLVVRTQPPNSRLTVPQTAPLLGWDCKMSHLGK